MAGVADVQVYDTAEAAAVGLGKYTADVAAEAINEHGAFTVAIAGGSLVKMLAGMKGLEGVQWDKWHMFWVDERCLPHSDPESNYGGAEKVLLSQVPIPKSNIYPINDKLYGSSNTGAAGKAAEEYDKTIKSLPSEVLSRAGSLPSFDLLLLGFGPDGHICSLFPNHALLDVNDERWILPITDSPKPPPERITFSLPVVNAAKNICFVACGGGKAEMAHIILDTSPAPGSIPAALVKPSSGKPVKWIMDTAAAEQITSATTKA
eukprot:CAMPEP_0117675304 /NCGR_PEP_ID=MMETSP0804-20121206/15531_1 /TAXON_ID=1074897 /ORGANISM="Tetraselmis astigmatica, Strain CCMP880" /LENGTH=262 /DNA_ID=CAMNT_0005484293 /DNA_START=61 /DNA_END=849 /DNA_ORIENTATION=-